MKEFQKSNMNRIVEQEENIGLRPHFSQGQPLGSERFSEIMCAAVGVRRAQRRPGRPIAKPDQSEQVEDQTDFGF